MKNEKQQESLAINQLFIFTASVFISLAFVKSASGIVAPFLLSVAIAVMLSPLFTYLESKHIPKSISLVAVILLVLLPIVFLGGYVFAEAKDFAMNYQTIKANFQQNIDHFLVYLNNFGIHIDETKTAIILEKSNLGNVLKGLATQASNQFSNLFLIMFMVAFMLMESKFFYKKMIKVANDYDTDSKIFIDIIEKVKSYFIIKVKTSFITAILVLLILWFFDINYGYMWAVLAFFLNFIPVVGSILAAFPAIAFALVDHGLGTMVWVAMGYLAINIVIGNILEPKIMGKGLGLSALVIFLSMTFWGYLLGPTGMILSAPLTMMAHYLFDSYRETRWIALMLSDYTGKVK